MNFSSSPSHIRRITYSVLLTLMVCGTFGCGQKGPLRLPSEPPVENQPQNPPETEPTESKTPSNHTNNSNDDKR